MKQLAPALSPHPAEHVPAPPPPLSQKHSAAGGDDDGVGDAAGGVGVRVGVGDGDGSGGVPSQSKSDAHEPPCDHLSQSPKFSVHEVLTQKLAPIELTVPLLWVTPKRST